MPVNTLITPSVVKIAEDVADKIYNFNPSDAPLLSMIGRRSVDNNYFEWQRDTFATPDGTAGAIEGADATYAAQTEPTLLNNRTQIFQDTVSVSNTAERVKKYGRDSEAKRLRMKKMIELKRNQEAACLGSGATVTGTQDTFIGAALGDAKLRRFLVAPKGAEVTGITETEDGKTLFVNIQHAGEDTPALGSAEAFQFQSQWPGNQGYGPKGRPRSATLVITRDDGGVIGL